MPSAPEPAPILGTWRRVYVLILGLLVFWIALFAIFTFSYRSFS